jgi:hypothetical protein
VKRIAFKQGEKYRCPDPDRALDRLCNCVRAPGDVRPRTVASRRLNFFDVPAVSSAVRGAEHFFLRCLADARGLFRALLSARSRYPLERSSQAHLSSQSPLHISNRRLFLSRCRLTQVCLRTGVRAGPATFDNELCVAGNKTPNHAS